MPEPKELTDDELIQDMAEAFSQTPIDSPAVEPDEIETDMGALDEAIGALLDDDVESGGVMGPPKPPAIDAVALSDTIEMGLRAEINPLFSGKLYGSAQKVAEEIWKVAPGMTLRADSPEDHGLDNAPATYKWADEEAAERAHNFLQDHGIPYEAIKEEHPKLLANLEDEFRFASLLRDAIDPAATEVPVEVEREVQFKTIDFLERYGILAPDGARIFRNSTTAARRAIFEHLRHAPDLSSVENRETRFWAPGNGAYGKGPEGFETEWNAFLVHLDRGRLEEVPSPVGGPSHPTYRLPDYVGRHGNYDRILFGSPEHAIQTPASIFDEVVYRGDSILETEDPVQAARQAYRLVKDTSARMLRMSAFGIVDYDTDALSPGRVRGIGEDFAIEELDSFSPAIMTLTQHARERFQEPGLTPRQALKRLRQQVDFERRRGMQAEPDQAAIQAGVRFAFTPFRVAFHVAADQSKNPLIEYAADGMDDLQELAMLTSGAPSVERLARYAKAIEESGMSEDTKRSLRRGILNWSAFASGVAKTGGVQLRASASQFNRAMIEKFGLKVSDPLADLVTKSFGSTATIGDAKAAAQLGVGGREMYGLINEVQNLGEMVLSIGEGDEHSLAMLMMVGGGRAIKSSGMYQEFVNAIKFNRGAHRVVKRAIGRLAMLPKEDQVSWLRKASRVMEQATRRAAQKHGLRFPRQNIPQRMAGFVKAALTKKGAMKSIYQARLEAAYRAKAIADHMAEVGERGGVVESPTVRALGRNMHMAAEFIYPELIGLIDPTGILETEALVHTARTAAQKQTLATARKRQIQTYRNVLRGEAIASLAPEDLGGVIDPGLLRRGWTGADVVSMIQPRTVRAATYKNTLKTVAHAAWRAIDERHLDLVREIAPYRDQLAALQAADANPQDYRALAELVKEKTAEIDGARAAKDILKVFQSQVTDTDIVKDGFSIDRKTMELIFGENLEYLPSLSEYFPGLVHVAEAFEGPPTAAVKKRVLERLQFEPPDQGIRNTIESIEDRLRVMEGSPTLKLTGSYDTSWLDAEAQTFLGEVVGRPLKAVGKAIIRPIIASKRNREIYQWIRGTEADMNQAKQRIVRLEHNFPDVFKALGKLTGWGLDPTTYQDTWRNVVARESGLTPQEVEVGANMIDNAMEIAQDLHMRAQRTGVLTEQNVNELWKLYNPHLFKEPPRGEFVGKEFAPQEKAIMRASEPNAIRMQRRFDQWRIKYPTGEEGVNKTIVRANERSARAWLKATFPNVSWKDATAVPARGPVEIKAPLPEAAKPELGDLYHMETHWLKAWMGSLEKFTRYVHMAEWMHGLRQSTGMVLTPTEAKAQLPQEQLDAAAEGFEGQWWHLSHLPKLHPWHDKYVHRSVAKGYLSWSRHREYWDDLGIQIRELTDIMPSIKPFIRFAKGVHGLTRDALLLSKVGLSRAAHLLNMMYNVATGHFLDIAPYEWIRPDVLLFMARELLRSTPAGRDRPPAVLEVEREGVDFMHGFYNSLYGKQPVKGTFQKIWDRLKQNEIAEKFERMDFIEEKLAENAEILAERADPDFEGPKREPIYTRQEVEKLEDEMRGHRRWLTKQGGFFWASWARAMEHLIGKERKRFLQRTAVGLNKAPAAARDTVFDLFSRWDPVMKAAAAYIKTKRGEPAWQVADELKALSQDYDAVEPSVKRMNQMPLGAVVASFPREAARIGHNIATRRPLKLLMTMAGTAFNNEMQLLRRGWNLPTYAAAMGKDSVPEQFGLMFGQWIWGWDDEERRWETLDLGRWLGVDTATEPSGLFRQRLIELRDSGFLGYIFSLPLNMLSRFVMNTPLLSAGEGVISNQDSWSGRPVSEPGASPAQRVFDAFEMLSRSMAPPYMPRVGYEDEVDRLYRFSNIHDRYRRLDERERSRLGVRETSGISAFGNLILQIYQSERKSKGGRAILGDWREWREFQLDLMEQYEATGAKVDPADLKKLLDKIETAYDRGVGQQQAILRMSLRGPEFLFSLLRSPSLQAEAIRRFVEHDLHRKYPKTYNKLLMQFAAPTTAIPRDDYALGEALRQLSRNPLQTVKLRPETQDDASLDLTIIAAHQLRDIPEENARMLGDLYRQNAKERIARWTFSTPNRIGKTLFHGERQIDINEFATLIGEYMQGDRPGAEEVEFRGIQGAPLYKSIPLWLIVETLTE